LAERATVHTVLPRSVRKISEALVSGSVNRVSLQHDTL